MKAKILTLVILILQTVSLSAQWEVKNFEENHGPLFVIKFFNSSDGLAMGANGLVLKSIDGGENWEKLENEITERIMDFEYLSLDTILALSDSFDGGVFERKIYKSIDGGLSWEQKYSGEGNFYRIQFMDNQKGIVAGSRIMLKSNDGGESWETVYDKLNGFDFGEIRRFKMVNDSIGYGVTTGKWSSGNLSESFFLETTDGGDSWQEKKRFESLLKEVNFLDENLGYIADYEYTYKTIDGGISWDTLNNLRFVADFSVPSASKVITVNRPEAYITVVSRIFSISMSQDSGETWDGEFRNGAHMETVFFQSDSIGFVAGDHAIIMKTENGGGAIKGNYPWYLYVTSTNELKESKLEFYPNPTSDKLFLTGLESHSDWNYSIETINGTTIKKGLVNNLVIDVTDIPQGLFFLILQKENHRKIGKFMKF